MFFPLRSNENGQAWAEIFKGLKTDSEYDPTNAYKALKPVKWIKSLKVIHVSVVIHRSRERWGAGVEYHFQKI